MIVETKILSLSNHIGNFGLTGSARGPSRNTIPISAQANSPCTNGRRPVLRISLRVTGHTAIAIAAAAAISAAVIHTKVSNSGRWEKRRLSAVRPTPSHKSSIPIKDRTTAPKRSTGPRLIGRPPAIGLLAPPGSIWPSSREY
jgi:hypothetical protein